jgi:hypothetical protein
MPTVARCSCLTISVTTEINANLILSRIKDKWLQQVSVTEWESACTLQKDCGTSLTAQYCGRSGLTSPHDCAYKRLPQEPQCYRHIGPHRRHVRLATSLLNDGNPIEKLWHCYYYYYHYFVITISGLLRTRKWTWGFHKSRGITVHQRTRGHEVTNRVWLT